MSYRLGSNGDGPTAMPYGSFDAANTVIGLGGNDTLTGTATSWGGSATIGARLECPTSVGKVVADPSTHGKVRRGVAARQGGEDHVVRNYAGRFVCPRP
jgi:hypothetical protein